VGLAVTAHDHEQAVALFGSCPTCDAADLRASHRVPVVPTAEPAGATYSPTHDYARLGAQARRVLTFMADGQWHTLAEIAAATHDPEASISARLRDLRKPEFGGYEVEDDRTGDGGLHRYRLKLPPA